MQKSDIEPLLIEIQRAFDRNDLDAVLQFYHPDISYIGPAFPGVIEGIERLRRAFAEYFRHPQRTRIVINDIKVQTLSDNIIVVHCKIEGVRSIHLSENRFRGRLSRVFVGAPDHPLVIHEHFSLSE